MAIQSLGDRVRNELAQIEPGTVALVEEPIQAEMWAYMNALSKDDQFRCLVLGRAMIDGAVSTAEALAAAKAGPDAVRAMADRLAA